VLDLIDSPACHAQADGDERRRVLLLTPNQLLVGPWAIASFAPALSSSENNEGETKCDPCESC
jgi:hypothetical protein